MQVLRILKDDSVSRLPGDWAGLRLVMDRTAVLLLGTLVGAAIGWAFHASPGSSAPTKVPSSRTAVRSVTRRKPAQSPGSRETLSSFRIRKTCIRPATSRAYLKTTISAAR